MSPWYFWIAYSLLMLHILKSIFFGGDYCFHCRWKYGKRYADWYANRPTFKPE